MRWTIGLRAPIDYVYFPTSGVISAMALMENGDAIEVATIGNEGMIGLSAVIADKVSTNEVIVQVAGKALWMEAVQRRCLRW